jgi:hypothetical protein
MGTNGRVLQGTHIRLELLEHRHVDGLAAASAIDPSLYQWSPVPQEEAEATNTSKLLSHGAMPEPQCRLRLFAWTTVWSSAPHAFGT